MSKGLEALKRIKSRYNDRVCIDILEDFDIIEKELKRLEELEKAFDALSKDDEKAKKELSKEIEKNRAFEIIKKKQVNIISLLSSIEWCNPSHYNDSVGCPIGGELTQEEYELLKEVLW